MNNYFVSFENNDSAFFYNGNFITDRNTAMNIIEKINNFYNKITDDEINAFNENAKSEWLKSMETKPVSIQQKRLKNEEYIKKYDSAYCSLSLQEIENLYENEKMFEAELIDMREIRYPLIVTFYKSEKPVYIGVNSLKLDKYVSDKRDQFEF
ncbi:hypothetical protein [Petrocella sp. FN5]|uniref:hypothetical protein n=1 Tax=Petrocella sp. FN5 TaxID=3032002 RepID=UPI0023DC05CB|nr:hypothetical protein [Petrocella sp. FN5]MDF1618496.1 hypothetical protein [Petrocella sp. FN5]